MKKSLLTVALVVLTLAPVLAEQVYVRNHAFKGSVTRADGQVWIELKPFAEALGTTISQSASGGWILQTKTGGEVADAPAGKVTIDGQEIEAKEINGVMMVPMDAAAKLLGARVVRNKDLGSIDISLAQAKMAGGPALKTGASTAAAKTGPIIIGLNEKRPGSAVDIPSALVPGRINIVEFGASW